MNIVSIDIGVHGAMACIDIAGNAKVRDLPTYVDDFGDTLVSGLALHRVLLEWVPIGMPCILAVENVRPRAHGNGGRSFNSVQSQGSLMQSRGIVVATASIARMPICWVDPQAWKRHFALKRLADETDTEVKEKSRQCALRLFPDFADTALKFKNSHNRAEALLIAHWARSTQT